MGKVQTDGRNTCRWIKDTDGTWYGDCRVSMNILNGTPDLAGFYYCQNCGRPIAFTIDGKREVPAYERDGMRPNVPNSARPDINEKPSVTVTTSAVQDVESVERDIINEDESVDTKPNRAKKKRGNLLGGFVKRFTSKSEDDDDVVKIQANNDGTYTDAQGNLVDISAFDEVAYEDGTDDEEYVEIEVYTDDDGNYYDENNNLIPPERYSEYGIDADEDDEEIEDDNIEQPVEQSVEQKAEEESAQPLLSIDDFPEDAQLDEERNIIVDSNRQPIDLSLYGLTMADFELSDEENE